MHRLLFCLLPLRLMVGAFCLGETNLIALQKSSHDVSLCCFLFRASVSFVINVHGKKVSLAN